MTAPFYAAANQILKMYERRQLVAKEKVQANSSCERYWACENLMSLAGAAAYAGSKEARVIRNAAVLWEHSEQIPNPFPEDLHEAHV